MLPHFVGYANYCPHVKLRENGAHFAYMIGGLIENLLDASLKSHFLISLGPYGLNFDDHNTVIGERNGAIGTYLVIRMSLSNNK